MLYVCMFSWQCELDHDNEVTCVDLDSDGLKVASGTVDGEWKYRQVNPDFETSCFCILESKTCTHYLPACMGTRIWSTDVPGQLCMCIYVCT